VVEVVVGIEWRCEESGCRGCCDSAGGRGSHLANGATLFSGSTSTTKWSVRCHRYISAHEMSDISWACPLACK
jgi:hypothetical protein